MAELVKKLKLPKPDGFLYFVEAALVCLIETGEESANIAE